MALAAVLGGPSFVHAGRQRQLLVHLVERVRAGDGASLKETVLALEVFGRSAARFDPSTDSIVRVEVRRLRQRLARHYATSGRDDPWEIQVPVGGYQPRLVRRGDGSAPPSTRHARDLVERGDHFLRQGAFASALHRYQQAVRLCPRYALAHLGAARGWINLSMSGQRAAGVCVTRALGSLARAQRLDPALAEAAALKGLVLHRFGHQWAPAEVELQRAVQLGAGQARVRALYGSQLMFAGLLTRADAELSAARALDPHNPAFRLHMVWLRLAQRRWDDAQAECSALLDVAPDHVWAVLTAADLHLYRRHWAAALEGYRAAAAASPGHADALLGQAAALVGLGHEQEARRLHDAAHGLAAAPSAFVQAELMAVRHCHEEALALLALSGRRQEPLFLAGVISPLFEPLYGRPEFQQLYRSARAVPLPPAAGPPPVACTRGGA